MKILVTVGTTSFDSLVKYIDTHAAFASHDIEFQIADGAYKPANYPALAFVDHEIILTKYRSADIVIAHAGAGTIYQLLDMRKKSIIVPNLDRSDKYQLDIADFLLRHNYAFVAYNFNQIPIFLKTINAYEFAAFHKTPFFKTEEILEFIEGRSAEPGKVYGKQHET
jgi:beta-1,4-N-acetylglucosaminyltransferase